MIADLEIVLPPDDYDQNYFNANRRQRYSEFVIRPKVEQISRKNFKEFQKKKVKQPDDNSKTSQAQRDLLFKAHYQPDK